VLRFSALHTIPAAARVRELLPSLSFIGAEGLWHDAVKRMRGRMSVRSMVMIIRVS